MESLYLFLLLFLTEILNCLYRSGKVSWELGAMMEVDFSTKKLLKLCSSERELRKEYGDQMAEKIMTRLVDLEAAQSLDDMRLVPGKCHELRSDLAGHLAVHLIQPNRLVFRPDHNPAPRNESGTLIWGQVTKIIVVGIGDYHS